MTIKPQDMIDGADEYARRADENPDMKEALVQVALAQYWIDRAFLELTIQKYRPRAGVEGKGKGKTNE